MGRKIAVLFAALCMLTGCAKESPTVYNNFYKNSQRTMIGNTDDRTKKMPAEKPETNEANTKSTVFNNIQQPEKASEPVVSPQPAPSKGVKMNFAELDKLDNTKYGWGLTLNNRHATPGIPSSTKKLISKYDALYIGDTSKKVVYLTFDEGYENGYTHSILDTLKADDVKSIFFITGPYLKGNRDLVKRMLDEGHQVGNHTMSHPSLPAVSDQALENEMLGLEKQFNSAFGKGFKYMRPPMGEYSERTLAAAKQLGYKTAFWSFAYLDYDVTKQKGADHAYNTVTANLHNGAVILLHAASKDNTEALDRIIKGIRAEGYEIRPFDL